MSASEHKSLRTLTRHASAIANQWKEAHPRLWVGLSIAAGLILFKLGIGLSSRFAPRFTCRADDVVRWLLPGFFIAIGLSFFLGSLIGGAAFLRSVLRGDLTPVQMQKKRKDLVVALVACGALTIACALDYLLSSAARDRPRPPGGSASLTACDFYSREVRTAD